MGERGVRRLGALRACGRARSHGDGGGLGLEFTPSLARTFWMCVRAVLGLIQALRNASRSCSLGQQPEDLALARVRSAMRI